MGNINVYPMFVDFPNQDYHISAGSPCIDVADNTAVPPDEFDLDGDFDTTEPIPFDLDGNPRFVDDPNTADNGVGDPPIVDMGAYEFQVVTCPADIDGSGAVDVKDLLFLLGAWGPCPKKRDCPADFDDSGDVDVKDLLVLLGAWGACP